MQYSASTTPISPSNMSDSTSALHLNVKITSPRHTSPQNTVRRGDAEFDPNYELIKLESELKCSVCKNFYDVPMSSKCQHTFCAGCAKFEYNNKITGLCCPICEYSFTSFTQFHKNTLIEDFIKEYKNNRDLVRRLCFLGQERERRKENKETTINISVTKSISDDKIKSKYTLENSINKNDSDLNEQNKRKRIDNESPLRPNKNTRTLNNSPCKKPKIAYGLMNEKKLKNILKEEGLSTNGPKNEMIARHSYFINLYNSNVDATNPKNKGELLREMKKWDKAHQSDEVKDANLLKKSLKNPEEIDSYAIKHRDHYTELIRIAGKTKKRREMS